MEITVSVSDDDVERLTVLLKAVNKRAIEKNSSAWSINDVAFIALSNGILDMEKLYDNYIDAEEGEQ